MDFALIRRLNGMITPGTKVIDATRVQPGSQELKDIEEASKKRYIVQVGPRQWELDLD